ncbi:restriction endonuclease subunit S [Streptococcus sanguinis]
MRFEKDWGRLGLKFEELSQVSSYVSERIRIDEVNLDNYVSTENMISERGGVTKATKLPSGKTISAFQKGDILISNIRPYFKKIWLAGKSGGCSNDVLVVRANEKISNRFLYYVLSSDNFFDYAVGTSKGTKMPRGDKKAIMKYEVPIYSLVEQEKIAEVLRAFDKKIILNKQINHHLEQIALSIFKEEFSKKEVTNKLGDFFPVITGKKDANIAKGGEYPFFSCSQNISYTDNYSFDARAILLAGNGDFNVKIFNGKFEAYQRTYVLIPNNDEHFGYLYYAIKYFLKDITSGHRGSVIKFITKGQIEHFDIFMTSNKEKLFLFNSFVENIAKNNKEIDKLTNIRDTLLPKLLSGEISVNQATK